MAPLPTPAPATSPAGPGSLDPAAPLAGILHAYVAYDWGEELDLERARALVPAEVLGLPRRRRTPSSIGYRPPPLRILLPPVALVLPEVGDVQATAEASLFDFAAVSIGLHLPFRLPAHCLTRLAGWLGEPAPVVQAARAALEPLYQRLRPAIDRPRWLEDLTEEYFVFQLPPCPDLPAPAVWLGAGAAWLAGLVRLEAGPLSTEEVAEALRLHLSYSPEDLFVPDWAAAALIDRDCEETLQTIEFANLQLLEFRYIDNRLDDSLAAAYRLVSPGSRSWLPAWRSHARPLRFLGGLKVEADSLFERTGNVFKLVGDQYLARGYRLLATRFHLQEWEQNIRRKLEVAEGVYQVVSDQAATYRTELLEGVVIVLILLEILVAVFRH
jgi:hypothetical protein